MKVLTEIDALKESTEDFLETNSRLITLTRHTKTRTETGGWVTSETVLEPQSFAIIGPTAGLRRAPEVPTDVGQVASYHLSLVGYPNADVRDSDTFELDGGKYRVDFVFPEHKYKTHAIIVYEGLIDSGILPAP